MNIDHPSSGHFGPWNLQDFMRESLRIEGIHREPTDAETGATFLFTQIGSPSVSDMEELVRHYAPGHRLRDQEHLNVRVGSHVAPRGGPAIREQLAELLRQCASQEIDAWRAHVEYEIIHPFTDGNGRSGRTLWLWCIGGRAPLGFLHQFYYQTLSNARL